MSTAQLASRDDSRAAFFDQLDRVYPAQDVRSQLRVDLYQGSSLLAWVEMDPATEGHSRTTTQTP